MSTHSTAVVGNIAATAAAVLSAPALTWAPTTLAEWVAIIAGGMSIIYWTAQFFAWLQRLNDHGD